MVRFFRRLRYGGEASRPEKRDLNRVGIEMAVLLAVVCVKRIRADAPCQPTSTTALPGASSRCTFDYSKAHVLFSLWIESDAIAPTTIKRSGADASDPALPAVRSAGG